MCVEWNTRDASHIWQHSNACAVSKQMQGKHSNFACLATIEYVCAPIYPSKVGEVFSSNSAKVRCSWVSIVIGSQENIFQRSLVDLLPATPLYASHHESAPLNWSSALRWKKACDEQMTKLHTEAASIWPTLTFKLTIHSHKALFCQHSKGNRRQAITRMVEIDLIDHGDSPLQQPEL